MTLHDICKCLHFLNKIYIAIKTAHSVEDQYILLIE